MDDNAISRLTLAGDRVLRAKREKDDAYKNALIAIQARNLAEAEMHVARVELDKILKELGLNVPG